jgi:rod shape-determining protein MreC
VYDKTVRRRRAVLGLLVALSLILLTAYFGEAAGGGLHAVQRGFLEVVSPIQDGASRALKPVRDLFGWLDDAFKARGQRDKLRKQLDKVRGQEVQYAAEARQAAQLRGLLGLDTRLKLSQYRPVAATVIGRSPTLWYSTVTVDHGGADGVHRDDPVIDGDGLVGKVTTVASDSAVVTLITDHASGVSSKVNESGTVGVVQPAVGNPDDLLLQYVRRADRVRTGQTVVTAGTTSSRLDSVFPPGIPIGQVTRVDDQDILKSVHVAPFAQLRTFEYVQILRRVGGGQAR